MLFCFNSAISQTIAKNKRDEFKGYSIIKTDWEVLFKKGSSWTSNSTSLKYRFTKIDETIMLDIKMILLEGKVFSISKYNELIFLFDDDTTLTYKSLYDVVASEGGAATGLWGASLWGLMASYSSEHDIDLKELESKKVKKIRIYTDEGFVEKEIKSKHSDILKKCIKLIKEQE
ncbi:hypothetical protein SAMN04488508_105310 [Aquimarina spongiae]|uniref:Uncharacterized protein n=2 Tax=Aquimarina spongiae TaxID=570521 RepID=A0A1M6GJ76_9FLAO|nr:hypothetical protein SAMN04488508_105310 [Aquimarina spongiae]